MAIKSPPGLIPLSHLSGEELLAHLRFNRVTDEKGRYLPFDELQYRIKKGENVDVAWTLTRLARNAAIQRINYCNEAGEQAGFNITPVIAEACELVDKRATALALKDQTERLRGAGAELSQLRLEEPITSSQLEGANTTTLVARKMLETGRSPRTEDEHMIAGNARLMASWKMAPALAAGNCVVLKPARLTPLSVLLLMEIVGDLLPPGVVNVVNGAGGEIGEYLATSKRIAKVAFTGSTEVGQQIMQYATQNIIPVTLELGGKSPNIFFADVMDEEDAFFDKALEGFALFAFNQGEVCTCPSRALVQESIYERFMERAIRRVESIRSGNPLDSVTQMGAQVSHGQLETILNYIDIGKKEGADVLTGGRRKLLEGELKDGYYLEPTILFGQNNMRVFQEEIFGPVLAVTTFKTIEEALELANDTQYGLGAGVWSRNGNLAYKMGRGIQAGRVWTNCYHAYPAHAAFGGYKQSGIGRETHKMMLEHYQQTKCLLVSYSDKPLGLF